MRALAAAFLLCGCGEAARNETAPAGSASVVVQSEDAVLGRRPELTLICANGMGSFSLALVRPAGGEGQPTGLVKVDDGGTRRIGLVSLGGDIWAPALEVEAESEIVRAMLAGRYVYFLGPELETELVFRWDLARVGTRIEELRARCS